MKYNIGDRVFDPECLEYIDNPFHDNSQIKMAFSVVEQANETHFSIYKDKKLEDIYAGMDMYQKFDQGMGKSCSYPNPRQFLHAEKDREIINEMLEKACDEIFSKEKEKRQKKIETQKAIIEKAHRAIKDLEENGVLDCLGKKHIRQRVTDNKSTILNMLEDQQ